jgi:BirA family biotin operon repressor/biotin-[acetyl-CoA-carboxylase] ligase
MASGNKMRAIGAQPLSVNRSAGDARPSVVGISGGVGGFSVDRLLAQRFVRQIDCRDRATSTNDLAIRAAADRALVVPALFLARCQTHGRGREDRRWWSPDGALTFSLVVEPEALGLVSRRWPELSLATALAVCDLVASILPGSSCRTKLPNDVLLNGRKLCGILVELPNCRGISRRRAVVGVGLNVNNRAAQAPGDIRDRVVSLADAALRSFDMTDILLRLLSAIEQRFVRLARGDREERSFSHGRCGKE